MIRKSRRRPPPQRSQLLLQRLQQRQSQLRSREIRVSFRNPQSNSKWYFLECEDLNAHCGMWEQLGHCQHSVKYMTHYCRKACGLCEVEVTTTTTTTLKPLPRNKEKENKSSTASTSSFKTTPPTTKAPTTTTTPKEKCEDKNLFCSYWAKIGECNSESKFMKIFCKASCGKCWVASSHVHTITHSGLHPFWTTHFRSGSLLLSSQMSFILIVATVSYLGIIFHCFT